MISYSALFRQPLCGALVVREDWKRRVDYVSQERVQDVATLAAWKPADAVSKLVPDLRADCALAPVLP